MTPPLIFQRHPILPGKKHRAKVGSDTKPIQHRFFWHCYALFVYVFCQSRLQCQTKSPWWNLEAIRQMWSDSWTRQKPNISYTKLPHICWYTYLHTPYASVCLQTWYVWKSICMCVCVRAELPSNMHVTTEIISRHFIFSLGVYPSVPKCVHAAINSMQVCGYTTSTRTGRMRKYQTWNAYSKYKLLFFE